MMKLLNLNHKMKLRYLIGLNTFSMLLIFTLYFAMAPSPLDLVKISGNRIIVNNNPYFIKGVCYHPVSKGDTKRSFDFLDKDLALMREAGINTIRLYEPVDDIVVLDKIEAAGMRLIIGFGYNQNGIFDIASGSYIDYVKKYKSHKAILIWELGNEYNYHPEWFDGDVKNWYDALNSATNLIHLEDPNHPVSTAHGDVPSIQALALNPNLDLWGLNVYRWDKPQSALKKWKQISSKPVYLSEVGADSYMKISNAGFEQGENQKAQATANDNIIDAVLSHAHIVSGLFVFSFTDGLWKAGNPDKQDVGGLAPKSSGVPYDGAPNEEFWGIVDINRNKKETYNIIKDHFTNFSINNKTPHE